MRARRLRLWLTTLLASVCLVAGRAAADAPAERSTPADLAFRRLASPVLEERREGVAALVGLLPGVRGRVIEALPRSDWGVQVHLIEVLARDGSEAALQALLDHLVRTEATQSVLIQAKLAFDRDAAVRLLAAWRQDPTGFVGRGGDSPAARERLRGLVALLRRAEIEELFLARKSKSGSTGYYKGQYESLRGGGKEPDYRRHALEVVTGIALDEAISTSGLYTSGVYLFVRPHHVDEWELRSMALNAVAELCTSEDREIVARLERRLVDLMGERSELYDRMRIKRRRAGDEFDSKPFQDALMEWDDALGEYLDLLACLHQIEPDRYARAVRSFVEELEGFSWPYVPLRRWSYIAALLIRAGWYDEALDAYAQSIGSGGSRALGLYNMACASASASGKTGLTAFRRERYLEDALHYLEASVEAGWSDLDWMNEDRDLEPLRAHRAEAYARLAERVKREWQPPEGDK